MLLIPIIEEWDGKLLHISKLVKMYEKRELRFEENCNHFLMELEQLAERDRLPLAQEIALIRGNMLKEYRLSSAKGESAAVRRKTRENVYLEGLEKANEQVRNFFAKDKFAMEECNSLLRQAIAVMDAKEVVRGNGKYHTNQEELFVKLYQDSELIPIVTVSVGKIGKINTKILIDQLLSQIIVY